MNSSGNNVTELKKEIKSLNKKIQNLIELCKACGIDENIILRTIQNKNNSSKRIANQQARFIEEQARNANQARNELQARNAQKARNANQDLAKRKKEVQDYIEQKKEDLFFKYRSNFINGRELQKELQNLEELEESWNFPI